MDIFTLLLVILAALTVIYYVVFFAFIYYWHLKDESYIVLPMIFTFDFFVTGFLIVVIISIVINYLPQIIKLFNSGI